MTHGVEENVGDGRVKLAASISLNFLQRLLTAQGLAVNPVVCHGVVGVCHRQNAAEQRDGLPL